MQKAVEMKSQGLTLRGMFHFPENVSGKPPLVLIFHGFTGNKMEPHFIFVKLSRMLEKKGIASLRFDFGGSGESDGEFINMTLSGEIRDAHNILDYACTLDSIDPERIGAVGLSMGGAVASALAGQRKKEIKALCLWAPAGNIGELVLAREETRDIKQLEKTGYVDLSGFLVGYDFFIDVQKLDIFNISRQYDKDVLLIHGDKDSSVPLSTSERYLGYYGEKGRLKVIKDGDHTFNNAAWEKEVLESTAAYFKDRLYT